MKLYRYVYRDAVTGMFVTEAFAKAHPRETIRQRVWWWQRQPAPRQPGPGVYGDGQGQ